MSRNNVEMCDKCRNIRNAHKVNVCDNCYNIHFKFDFATKAEEYNALKDNTIFINYVSKKIAKRIEMIQDFNDGALDKNDLVSILQSYLPKYLNKSKHIVDKLN